jgi:hypothetical protein
MGSTVGNAFGDRKKLVVDGPGLLVVLGLSRLDQLNQRLGCDVAVSNQEPVHVKCGMQQILVVSGEDLQFWPLATNDRNLSIPVSHVADTILHRKDARLC